MQTTHFNKVGSVRLPCLLADNQRENFTLFLYRFSSGHDYYVIEKGNVRNDPNPFVRIQSACSLAHVFNTERCNCQSQLDTALFKISQSKSGLLIYAWDQDGKGLGRWDYMRVCMEQDAGKSIVESYRFLKLKMDKRNYREAIAIVKDYQLKRVQLLTDNARKVEAFERAGIEVTRTPLTLETRRKSILYVTSGNSRWHSNQGRRKVENIFETSITQIPTPFDSMIVSTELFLDQAIAYAKKTYHEHGSPILFEYVSVRLNNSFFLVEKTKLEKILKENTGKMGVIQIALVYYDGKNVIDELADIPGAVASSPRGRGTLLEQWWEPRGYPGLTLGELRAKRFYVSKWERLLLNIASRTGVVSATKIYEAHITVTAALDFPDFQKMCIAEGVKAIEIVNVRGESARHSISASIHKGGLAAVIREVHTLSQSFETKIQEQLGSGYAEPIIIREKIEAQNWDNPIVRQLMEEQNPSAYWEIHFKVEYPDEKDTRELRALCRKYNVHFSGNPSNTVGNLYRHFLTARASLEITKDQMERAVTSLQSMIMKLGYPVVDIEKELSVYDTRPDHDHFDRYGPTNARRWLSDLLYFRELLK